MSDIFKTSYSLLDQYSAVLIVRVWVCMSTYHLYMQVKPGDNRVIYTRKNKTRLIEEQVLRAVLR